MPIQSPPLDGSLPAVWGALDWRAKHTPSDPWIVFPYGDYSDERVCLTFADCATASHRVAYALHLARVSSQDRVIAAVLVNTDNIHYALLMSGIMRAGLIPLPISTSTPPDVICDILSKANCHRILTCSTVCMYFIMTSIKSLCEKRRYHVRVDELPSLDFILPHLRNKDARKTMNVGPYPTNGTTHKPSDVALYLQPPVSGNSQKPVPMTHEDVAEWQRKLVEVRKGGICANVFWAAMSLPSHDSSGILMQLLMPLATGEPIALFQPRAPAPRVEPTPQHTLELARKFGCTGMITLSHFLEEWAQDPEAVLALSRMKLVCYAGPELSPFTAAALTSIGIHLASFSLEGISASRSEWREAKGRESSTCEVEVSAPPSRINPLIHALQRHSMNAHPLQ